MFGKLLWRVVLVDRVDSRRRTRRCLRVDRAPPFVIQSVSLKVLRAAIAVFVSPLIGLEQSRIREVDRLVLAK